MQELACNPRAKKVAHCVKMSERLNPLSHNALPLPVHIYEHYLRPRPKKFCKK